MRIDLHTHSNVSDGTDRPGDLVRRAGDAALDVVALTDHDTVDGWPAARGAAGPENVLVVPGLLNDVTFAPSAWPGDVD